MRLNKNMRTSINMRTNRKTSRKTNRKRNKTRKGGCNCNNVKPILI